MDDQSILDLMLACAGSIGVVIIAHRKFVVDRLTTDTLEQVQGILQGARQRTLLVIAKDEEQH